MRMFTALYFVALAWGLSLASCAPAQVARIRLPEPILPLCAIEETPTEGHVVGAYTFRAAWVASAIVAPFASDPKKPTTNALQCASDALKALREAVTAIRLNNSK